MEKEKPGYFAIISADVRYDARLSPSEKLLYGEITALANKYGYCWAENRYFAELYEVHKITVSNWLKNLEKRGYIRTELEYIKGTKQVGKRYIFINTPVSEDTNTPVSEKINTPISENTKEDLNNTSNNNTRNINTSSSNSTILPYKEIVDYLNEKGEKQYKHTTNKTKTLIAARFNEGFTLDDFKRVIDVKSKEWKGDPKMDEYIRPQTLFSNKFESYLNQKEALADKKGDNKNQERSFSIDDL